MPGLLQRSSQFNNGPSAVGSPGIWSKHRDHITFDHLQKFWNEMPLQARRQLLRVDKQALFEQVRKNLYCSRCNGLLLEGFSQIVSYGKSLQLEGAGGYTPCGEEAVKGEIGGELDVVEDTSVHPWGGLATTRDGILTLLDCFIDAKSLKALQNVFDNARAREHERELLYPDACGGGGRGWISQGMANYGRGYGTRETCALHTARLSCNTLVDFWLALSDETRLSLLRMKEEDFIERLVYRFDSKRFCRDCRRNVIREFKELKELKRMRREPRCSSWFCVADTAFQYEVLEDTVEADWHQPFTDTINTYHHFEWAIGTGEGKSDILEFEDVGMNGKVQVNGLDLSGLSACFITLKAWKLDGRCTELCVKAHALKGHPCVHRRLIVGDGFVTITKGESIRRFFEHAEEAEEEEDDDGLDKDGNELDGDGSRPQKHAKSPELAREFLLDAATVIFKEQVEKAFREGTARQNAHSIFVCLALKLLEERIHVACKEIITLEKQVKLLEEEEREKQEEEERKERRRAKEREKKLRRKERLKGKEKERDRKHNESESHHFDFPTSPNESSNTHDDSADNIDSGDSISEQGDTAVLLSPVSLDTANERWLDDCINAKNGKIICPQDQFYIDGEFNSRDGNGSFVLEQSKSSRRKLRFRNDSLLNPVSKWCINGIHRPSRERIMKTKDKGCSMKSGDKFHRSNIRGHERYDFQSSNYNQKGYHRSKNGYHSSSVTLGKEIKGTNRTGSSLDTSRPLFRSTKYSNGCYIPDNCVIPKGKPVAVVPSRDYIHIKQVWEPMDPRKKCARSISDPDFTLKTAAKADSLEQVGFGRDKANCEHPPTLPVFADDQCLIEFSGNSSEPNASSISQDLEDTTRSSTASGCHDGYAPVTKPGCNSKDDAVEGADSYPIISEFPTSDQCDAMESSSSSDICSSCINEGDSSAGSSSAQNAESSSTSDSEDASQQSDGRYDPTCKGNACTAVSDDTLDCKIPKGVPFSASTVFPVARSTESKYPWEEATIAVTGNGGRFGADMASQQHMPLVNTQRMHVPIFPSPILGYHPQSAPSWSAPQTNGLVTFPHSSHCVFSTPFGYGLAANHSSDFGMQYKTLPPVVPHLSSLCQHSSYQTTSRPFVVQVNNIHASPAQTINGASAPIRSVHPLERPGPSRLPSEPPSVGQNGRIASKPNADVPSFSLFHFGGPIGSATACSANPVSKKDGYAGGFGPNSAAAQVNVPCSKEDTTIEEYSLFASSNSARFSFF